MRCCVTRRNSAGLQSDPGRGSQGWFLFTTRQHTEAIGVPLPEGIPNHAETVARYEHITGHQARNVEHYEAFAGVRLAILMVRAARMMIAGGMLPPDSTMAQNNPICQLVAKMLGLPAPAGAVTSYVGKRGETTE